MRCRWFLLPCLLLATGARAQCNALSIIQPTNIGSDIPLQWPDNTVVTYQFSANFPESAKPAVRTAIATWDLACDELSFSEGPAPAKLDITIFTPGGPSYPFYRAVTPHTQDVSDPVNLPIDQVEMSFNFNDFPLSGYDLRTTSTAAPGLYSLLSLALHELGHALGLQHPTTSCTFSQTVMVQGMLGGPDDPIVLGSVDKAAMKFLYGKGAAAALDGAWGYPATDGFHVSWLSAHEIASREFRVLGRSRGIERVLTTTPAVGGAWQQFYDVRVPAGMEGYRVVEVGSNGTIAQGAQVPVFAAPPEQLDVLSRIDHIGLASRDPAIPESFSGSPPTIEPVSYDFYLYSSRQDFLDAAAPMNSRLQQGGYSTTTILGPADAQSIRASVNNIYASAVANHHPLPFVILVGSAYQDAASPRNVVGTWYFENDYLECFWGCASDAKLMDGADDDDIPNLPWTRILGTTVADIQRSVRAALYFLSGQYVSPQRALIFTGDRDAYWDLQPEPRLTLNSLANSYASKQIPTVTLNSASFSGTNYSGLHDAFVSAMNAGVTEILGTGWISNSWEFPGDFLQRTYAPRFEITDISRTQLFVAELPGCGTAGEDRLNPSGDPTIIERFMTADPDHQSTAVAWFGHKRGGTVANHLALAQRYFQNRLAVRNSATSLQEVYFQTLRQLAGEEPAMRGYLLGAAAYGWPIQLPDMRTLAPPPVCRGCEFDSQSGPQALTPVETPNPFRGAIRIRFELRTASHVKCSIYDLGGRLVRQIGAATPLEAGVHEFEWDGRAANGSPCGGGVYFYRLRLARGETSGRLVLVR